MFYTIEIYWLTIGLQQAHDWHVGRLSSSQDSNQDSAPFLSPRLLVDSRSSIVDNQGEPSQMVWQYLFCG